MNVLIACEESQAICIEMRKRGHRAFSCDLQECSGGHPEWHIVGDVLPLINGRCEFKTQAGTIERERERWDLLIAHPPCTYLSNAGARHLYKVIDGKRWLNLERYHNGLKGKEFFMQFLNADCDRICVENPIPSSIYELPEYTQVVQPYEYGHNFSKKTCLWLKGLPKLQPTDIVSDHVPYCTSGSYRKTKTQSTEDSAERVVLQRYAAKPFRG